VNEVKKNTDSFPERNIKIEKRNKYEHCKLTREKYTGNKHIC